MEKISEIESEIARLERELKQAEKRKKNAEALAKKRAEKQAQKSALKKLAPLLIDNILMLAADDKNAAAIMVRALQSLTSKNAIELAAKAGLLEPGDAPQKDQNSAARRLAAATAGVGTDEARYLTSIHRSIERFEQERTSDVLSMIVRDCQQLRSAHPQIQLDRVRSLLTGLDCATETLGAVAMVWR